MGDDLKDNLKIVMVFKNGRTSIAVQEADCDPVMELLTGTLEEALSHIPSVLDRARERWRQSPRYPKSSIVPPAPPPSVPRTQGVTRPRSETQEKAQMSRMF